ncbi:MAG TPA: hypothetical protein VGT41_04290 [Candidatus Babeliales bacterium]|nr:hypothetical protein [Candidatus Babeliales bacterium]
MKRNRLYMVLLVLSIVLPTNCFAANAVVMKRINQEMQKKTATAAQMASLLVEAASTGEEQWVRMKVAIFVHKLRDEAERGALSYQEAQHIGERAAAGIEKLRNKPKQGKAIAQDLRHLVQGLKHRDGVTPAPELIPKKPTPEPTPEPKPTPTPEPKPVNPVTPQDLNNYINALTLRLYQRSMLKNIENSPSSNVILVSERFRAALGMILTASTTANQTRIDRQKQCKNGVLAIMRNLAENNLAEVDAQLNLLPDTNPYVVIDTLNPAPFSHQDYLTKKYNSILYQTILQLFIRTEKLFDGTTLEEINATIAAVSRDPMPGPTTPTSTAVTQQDLDNYVMALMSRLYQTTFNGLGTSFKDQNSEIVKASNRFKAALAAIGTPPPLSTFSAEHNNYKSYVADILRSLATNDIVLTTRRVVNELPAPSTTTYPAFILIVAAPFTYQDFLTNTYNGVPYKLIIQQFARNEKLFDTKTKTEITATIQAVESYAPSNVAITQQDRNNYVDALIKRLYQKSTLKDVGPVSPGYPLSTANKLSFDFRNVLNTIGNIYQVSFVSGLMAAYSIYKTRFTALLNSLAMDDIKSVNTQLSQLLASPALSPNPSSAPAITYGFHYPSYLGMSPLNKTYQSIVHQFIQDERLFENVSAATITATIQSVP